MRILIIICVVLFGCLAYNNPKAKDLKVIRYLMRDKIISLDTLVYETDYKIAYNGELELYEVPTIKMIEFGIEMDSGRVYKKLKPSDTTFSYHVFKKGINTGLSYDSLFVQKPHVCRKDSLLKMINLDSTSLSFYGIELGKPLEVIKQKNTMLEKYGKILATDPDSIYRYYDETLDKLPFSFSKSLDKEKGMKLWKTVYIYHRSVDKNNKVKPRIEALTKIEDLKIKNAKEYISLFQRFEKESVSFKVN